MSAQGCQRSRARAWGWVRRLAVPSSSHENMGMFFWRLAAGKIETSPFFTWTWMRRIALAAGLVLTLAAPAWAAIITWDGGGTDGTCGGGAGDGNKWSCAANWVGHRAWNDAAQRPLGVEQADEGEMADTMLKTTVGGDQLQVKLLRKPDIEGVVERQPVATRQADRSLGQLGSGHDQFELETVEGVKCPLDVVFWKAGIVDQGVGDFINQEVWHHNRGLSGNVGIPHRKGQRRVRFVHEPLQGDRGVDDRHYRDSRSLRMTFTLSQPGGAFRRSRSMAAAARSMRAWSRTFPLIKSSTAFVIAAVVYHTPRKACSERPIRLGSVGA